MNSFIETLNHWGGNFLDFAWPMLWQSSLLIVVLFAFDFLFRRKLRASIRYALWLVVLVKLCVPPTLALPTSPAWWLHKTPPPPAAKSATSHYTVTYDNDAAASDSANSAASFCSAKTGDDVCRVAAGYLRGNQFGFAALAAGALVANHAASSARENFRTTGRARR